MQKLRQERAFGKRESRFGCQIDATAKAESRLRLRYQQMKDARPFEEFVSVKNSDELSDQKRLSILSWTAGPKRGKVAKASDWSRRGGGAEEGAKGDDGEKNEQRHGSRPRKSMATVEAVEKVRSQG